MAVDLERNTEAIAAQREGQYRARRLHAGHRFEPRLQVDEELRLFFPVIFFRQAEIKGENIRGLQTAVHSLQPPETLNQQSRADEQHDRNREFGDYQNAADLVASRAFAVSAS